jgi:hypothetical protein
VEEADDMIEAAARAGVALAVGHTERFNPAIAAARPLIDDPRFIEVHRLGTFPDRSLDIDVVFDLMIHDLDVVLSIVKSDVASVEAVGVPVLTDRVDIANARVRFVNGCIANICASRISRDRVRKVRFFQPAAYVSIDYADQKVAVWRLRKGEGPKPAIEGGLVEVASEEPLKRELTDFVEAVAAGRPPLVTGEQGPPRARARDADYREDGLSGYTVATKSTKITKGIPRVPGLRVLRVFVVYSLVLPMYSDLTDFLDDLDRRRLLARVGEPVSPELEIAALTDLACKAPGGGPALLFERPAGFDIPVATNVFGSTERMCLALGVKALDDLAAEINELMTPAMPQGSWTR